MPLYLIFFPVIGYYFVMAPSTKKDYSTLSEKFTIRFGFVLLVQLIILFLILTTGVNRTFKEEAKVRLRNATEALQADFEERRRQIEQAFQEMVTEESKKNFLAALLANPEANYNVGQQLMKDTPLEILDILSEKGVVLTSAHWPMNFGHPSSLDLAAAENIPGRFTLRDERVGNDVFLTLQIADLYEFSGVRLILSGGYRIDREFQERMKRISGCRVELLEKGKDYDELNTETSTGEKVRGLAGLTAVREFDGASYFASYPELFSQLGEDNYRFCILLPRTGLVKLMTQIKWVLAGLSLLAFLISWLVSRFLARNITRPVQELVRGAEILSQGNLEHEITLHTNDELQVLVDAFNTMVRNLKENEARLVRMEKIAAWRDVARRLAHELKNPLFPIQLSMQTMQRAYERQHPDLPQIFNDSTKTILEEVERMNRIISEFSEFARMPKPKLEKQDLNAVVRHALLIFSGLPETITLEVVLDDELPLVMIDKDKMCQVLINLMKNAIEAMENEGKLLIETGKITDESQSGKVFIKLCDTGPGIPEELLSKLFDPYVSGKEKGTGLGLAIAARIIFEHGGEISAKNRDGRGAEFVIRL